MGDCLGGLEGGWIGKSGSLAEKSGGSATKEWELSEMTALLEVCGYILCEVGCTDSLLFKENYWEEWFIWFICVAAYQQDVDLDRLIINICGEDEYNFSAVGKAFLCVFYK